MEDPLKITPVTRTDAATLWPYVRERLKSVEDELGQTALPERVYAEWLTGRATVVTLSQGGRLLGAAVVTGPEATESMKRRLWVWALSVEEFASLDARRAFNDWLIQAARSVGAHSVGMSSPREGWGRYLKSMGWKPVQIEYELEVKHGG